jgi:hypothetical protein
MLSTNEVRFQPLLLRRDGMHIAIESHLAQDQFPTLDTRLRGAGCAGVKESAAKAVAPRMAKNQYAAHAGRSTQLPQASENETCAYEGRYEGRPAQRNR